MGRHKRIESKKRNKLKSVDPFNTQVDVNKEKLEQKRNNAPSVNQLDEQSLPRAWDHVHAWKDDGKIKKRSKKKKNLSVVELESKKIGIEKRPFETTKRFLQRVNAITQREMQEAKDKARFGMAGRDRKEVAEDEKALDEDLKRKKAVKKEQVKNLMANRKGAKEQRVLDKKAERTAEVAARKAEVERQKRAEVHKQRRRLAKISKPKNISKPKKENPHSNDRDSVIEMYRQMKKQKPAGHA
uniref:Coiled-coil domain-containing protein 86 n=1 Tax=Steinernema glaseri TaxID=37863 RepID=A0A1I7ZR52_9BILA